ncbi:MAG: twin-arginine translocase TatA/TatE family subunit [bacterium]|nr:twin-arginine translocase TatA/TatE family subunit [bacterium]
MNLMLPFLQNIGPTEVIIIAVVLVILFGGKKIPEFGRGLGEVAKTFKQALQGQSKDK